LNPISVCILSSHWSLVIARAFSLPMDLTPDQTLACRLSPRTSAVGCHLNMEWNSVS
jgi:hypothetical protein